MTEETKKTMRGVLYYGPNDLRFSKDIPMPTISHPDEVMIKISYCGICGTDLLSYKKGSHFFDKIHPDTGHPLTGKKLPQVMGHEFSGTIVAVGDSVRAEGKFNLGDDVVCEPTCYCADKPRWPDSKIAKDAPPPKNDHNSICGHPNCEYCEEGMTNICEHMGITGLGCTDGGLAEYVVVSKHHLVKVPKWIPMDCAALVQPLSVSYHAFRTCGFKKGSSALIVGCGSIGIGCILSAQAFGAGKIVCSEPAQVRREQAKALGVDAVYNPKDSGDDFSKTVQTLKSLSPGGRGFDYAFDCSGFPITFKTGLDCIKARGKLVNLAIWPTNPMDFYPMDFTSGEKSITGSMCYTLEDFEGVINAMADHRISLENCKKLITKKVMLEDAVDGGFEELVRNKDNHVKILITPKTLKDGKEVDSQN
ncbi:hypothetical protein DASC09_010840 [Saccharomycopsis crataegensis]|uniref:Enoyl reductase (ER) domain-containing protein n=1 Tax=Saccharomycopsis crataegensis TaxID=43959 RepID=A0AAV5QGA7_9ASCO|nr:hypothetical protein DASC09_010840 [Saccharomycopsis crataegensis]